MTPNTLRDSLLQNKSAIFTFNKSELACYA
jgi:hypothetical protein